MNDALKMAREALKPCPHCGLAHTLKLTTAQELAEEGEDDPEPWMHSDSWAVMCDASRPSGPGGCGASGGFYPSEAEAVEAWNRRAAIDAQQAAPTVTGGSPEHLLQDQDRGLSQWLASKPDARLRVREACADIAAQQAATVGAPSVDLTDQTPKALRLANALEGLQGRKSSKSACEAAAELRRLHAANVGQTRLNVTLVMENADLLRQLMSAQAPAATPPAVQAQPVALTPLTDEQIDALWRAPMSADWEHREFAHAIEAAHGIGAAAQGGEHV